MKFSRARKTVKKSISAFFGVFGIIILLQLHQTIDRVNTARIDAAYSWSLNSSDNKLIFEKYKSVCESTEANVKQVTIIGCAETVNSELASAINQAVDDVQPPVPLAWFF